MATIINGLEVKEGGEFFGVRYWAQWWKDVIPKYTIFRYIGSHAPKDLHFFMQHNSGNILVKTHQELCVDATFRPFLYHLSAIDEAIQKRERGN